MTDSKWTWRSVSLISIAATLILMGGFVYAVNDILHPVGDAPLTSLPQETMKTETQAGNELRVVALGDSLAKGTGDKTGAGFARRTVAELVSGGESAKFLGNLGINGLTTTGLQKKLKEEGVRYTLRQANVILLSIGGNDLFRGADLFENGGQSLQFPDNAEQRSESASPQEKRADTPSAEEEPDLTPESLTAAIPEASERLDSILATLAEINPSARIYYLGLYNPFGDVPDMLVPGNQAVTAWNNAAMDVINRNGNMTLVPTFDLFNGHWHQYLSSDHFHPNGDGYQRMGIRIVQALR